VKRERIFTHKNAHSEKKKRTLFAVKLVDRKKKETDARKIYWSAKEKLETDER